MRGWKMIVLVDSAEWNRVILRVAPLFRHSVSSSTVYIFGNHEDIHNKLLQILRLVFLH